MAVSSVAPQGADPVAAGAYPVECADPAGLPPGRAVQSADRSGTAGRHGREDDRTAAGMARVAAKAAAAVASTLAARGRRPPRAGLPPPATVAGGIAMALLEIEAGCRSVAQLERVCTPQLWSKLEHTVRRRGGPFPAGHALIRVHCQNHSAELADAVALVRRGERTQAIVIRLQAAGDRWMVSILELLGQGGRATRASGRGSRGG
jgi:Family of unknown function (DUF6459)